MTILEQVRRKQHGFIRADQIDTIVAVHRLQPLLVRCGSYRFTAPAQDVVHLLEIIRREGSDYVRDVSLPER